MHIFIDHILKDLKIILSFIEKMFSCLTHITIFATFLH